MEYELKKSTNNFLDMLWNLENKIYLCGDQRQQILENGAFFLFLTYQENGISCPSSYRATFSMFVGLWSDKMEAGSFFYTRNHKFNDDKMTKDVKLVKGAKHSNATTRKASEKANSITFNKTILDGLFMTMPADRFGYAVGIVAKGYDDDDVLFRQGKDVQLAVNLLTTKIG